MEFPDLGEQCSLKECRRLDFLPIKCTSCSQIFCGSHFQFKDHNCPREDDQQSTISIITCPLCNKTVPVRAGESADNTVSEHIEQNCKSSQGEPVFKNRCSMASCKKRELIPLTCEVCSLNHCLTHRHPRDHMCPGPKKAEVEKKKEFEKKVVSIFVCKSTSTLSSFFGPSFSNLHTLQGGLSEEEALNKAIQQSLQTSSSSNSTSKKEKSKNCRIN